MDRTTWNGEAITRFKDHLLAFHRHAKSTREDCVDLVDTVCVLRKSGPR